MRKSLAEALAKLSLANLNNLSLIIEVKVSDAVAKERGGEKC